MAERQPEGGGGRLLEDRAVARQCSAGGLGAESYACEVYSTGGDPFTSCDPSFASECGTECECVVAMHPECTDCAVVGGGIRAECSI